MFFPYLNISVCNCVFSNHNHNHNHNHRWDVPFGVPTSVRPVRLVFSFIFNQAAHLHLHPTEALRLRVRRLIIGYYFSMRDNGWYNIGTKLEQLLVRRLLTLKRCIAT